MAAPEAPTTTSMQQDECEAACAPLLLGTSPLLKGIGALSEADELVLLRERHALYLTSGLGRLPGGFVSLDASRSWIVYWILHGLSLLEAEPVDDYDRVVETLRRFQATAVGPGGFGGGPQQVPHLAPTYAAVLALVTVGTAEALDAVDRAGLYKFFMEMKHPSGGFSMQHDGEVDARGTYTAVAIAALTNILTEEFKEGVVEYLLSCQTYEGGFGGEPGNEAHGGYNYCAMAALVLLRAAHRADLDAQEFWLVNRQMETEGGFQGRTNKLVDGCYSFWQGAAFALVAIARAGYVHPEIRLLDGGPPEGMADAADEEGGMDALDVDDEVTEAVDAATPSSGPLSMNQFKLQDYVLRCAQFPQGGLRDKPGKHRDFYHSCYCLSGLAVAQHGVRSPQGGGRPHAAVLGEVGNLLADTSPLFNVRADRAEAAILHYRRLPTGHAALTSA